MVRISNFLDDPRAAKEYKSLRHLARCFEQSINPSKRVQRLLGKMLSLGFFSITSHDVIVFDAQAFDKFIEEHAIGREWWAYFDNHTLFPRIK